MSGARDKFDSHVEQHALVAPALPKLLEGISKAEGMGYASVTQDGTITSVNSQFLHLISDDQDTDIDAVGLNLRRVIKALELRLDGENTVLSFEDRIAKFEEGFRATEPHNIRLTALTNKGRYIRLNCWFPGTSDETEPMFVTVKDSSKYNQYRRLYDLSMQSANAGFWSVSFVTGEFTYSNSVLERLTEEEIKRMSKGGIWAIVHPDDQQSIQRQWLEVFQNDDNDDFDFEYRVVTEKEGLMWQRSTGQIERAENGRVIRVTGFVMDITKEIQNQNQLIQEQETSLAKSNFLARMSHEIRTPLNAIIGMSDSLKDENLTADVRGVIDDIEDAAEGLNKLLSRTLDHSKLISKKMQLNVEVVNPKAVLANCQRLWRPQITSKGLDFKVAIDPNLPETLKLDEFRIQQCVNNLLSNAVKFTTKGSISLIMKVADVKGAKRLVIAVKDQGIGMSPEQTARVFDDFTQADESISRQFGGTGLGMSITKELCELMGGKVLVKSEKGVGTTFMLMLPTDMSNLAASQDEDAILPRQNTRPESKVAVAKDQETVETNTASNTVDLASNEGRPFEGLNVLCVEDNPVNQKVVNRLIGNRVKQIQFANNGREALNVLNTAPIDVVLMDIHMPVMDGIETTMEIRRSNSAYANVIIIALTADPDYQQKRICRNIGMDDTIGKPVRREDILNAFNRNLGHLSKKFGQPVTLSA